MRRVHWMELFFDLVFVVFVGQLAHGMHGEPGWAEYAGFLFVFAIGWWAWVNVTVAINVLPNLPVRRLTLVMLLGMIAVGAMAVAAPEAIGDRGWFFALGCAGLRLILLPLWFLRAKRNGIAVGPTLLYNGGTALIWIGSAFIPQPAQFFVWAAAVAIEVILITVARSSDAPLADSLDIPHLAERLGLFVIIVMGESVFSVIEAFSEHWDATSGVVALVGLLLIGLLAWTYFLHSARYFEEGLETQLEARNTLAIRDAVMFMPFALVAGVTAVAAGLATAIEHPDAPLALGSAVGLFVGLALFALTVGLVGIRLGRSARGIVPWVALGTALPVVALVVGQSVGLPAWSETLLALVTVAILTAFTEIASRSPRATSLPKP